MTDADERERMRKAIELQNQLSEQEERRRKLAAAEIQRAGREADAIRQIAKQMDAMRDPPPTLRDPLRDMTWPVPPRVKPLAEIIADQNNLNSASEAVRHVLEQVYAFEAALDDDHEVALHLVNFGPSLTIRVRSVGALGPSLVVFEGQTDNDEVVRLVQHHHQLSFLLTRAERLHPDTPRPTIGFIAAEQ